MSIRSGGPMRRTAIACRALAIGGLAFACGCAKHVTPNADTATHSVSIEVKNDFVDVTPVDVWLIDGTDAGATRRDLGTVPGDGVMTFTFTPSLYGQYYVLEADVQMGRPMKSSKFSVNDESITRISWTLKNNVVTYFSTN
jgi:hypothetical protein